MKAELSLIKVTQDGEQLSVKIEDFAPGEKTLMEYARPYLDFLDQRLMEMNTRVMAANEMVRSLTPEEQLAIHNVSETLFGQIPNSEMNQLVHKARLEVQKKEQEHVDAVERGKAIEAENAKKLELAKKKDK